MTNVQDTSIEAYHDTHAERKTHMERIVALLRVCPGLCDKEIAKNIGIELSSVCAARNQLMRDKVIESPHDKESPFTGRRVKAWRIKASNQGKRTERTDCIVCMTKGCDFCGGKGYHERVIEDA